MEPDLQAHAARLAQTPFLHQPLAPGSSRRQSSPCAPCVGHPRWIVLPKVDQVIQLLHTVPSRVPTACGNCPQSDGGDPHSLVPTCFLPDASHPSQRRCSFFVSKLPFPRHSLEFKPRLPKPTQSLLSPSLFPPTCYLTTFSLICDFAFFDFSYLQAIKVQNPRILLLFF